MSGCASTIERYRKVPTRARFYHIKQSCDLTCIKQNMGIDSSCLELTGKCHDLYRIRIEKN